jgi:hypothetical protein
MYWLERLLKILFALIVIAVYTQKGFSQEWNTARISVLYGNNIPFNFNTLEKIKNGIEIVNGTQIGISLADSNVPAHDLTGFVLNFRSFNGQSEIRGDVHSLPLNRIQVRAENALGLSSGVSFGYLDLTALGNTLFSYTNATWVDLDWLNYQLNISYECGKPLSEGGNGSLLGEEPDYYNVEIELELVPTGPGF